MNLSRAFSRTTAVGFMLLLVACSDVVVAPDVRDGSSARFATGDEVSGERNGKGGGGGKGSPRKATRIVAVSPLNQSAAAGAAVNASPTVRVVDARGRGVSGVVVTFTVTSGGGLITPASPASIITNDVGEASLTSWTITATSTVNDVVATAQGLDGISVKFSATWVTESLLAYYPFTGSFDDASGNGRHGTQNGSVSFVDDRNNVASHAASFAGGFIDIGLLELTGSFTIAGWIRFTTTPAGGMIIASNIPTSGTIGWTFLTVPCWDNNNEPGNPSSCTVTGGRILKLHTGSLVGSFTLANTVTATSFNLAPSTWYHVAATIDGTGTASLYVNGALIIQRGGVSSPSTTGSIARIGKNAMGGEQWGPLDDLRFYQRALSAGEIATLSSLSDQ